MDKSCLTVLSYFVWLYAPGRAGQSYSTIWNRADCVACELPPM
jgi:hypothetical protein